MQARAAQEVGLFTRLRARFRYPDDWHRSSPGGLRLTSAELVAFVEDHLALLTWYAFRHGEPPAQAREILVRFYAFPRADLDDATT